MAVDDGHAICGVKHRQPDSRVTDGSTRIEKESRFSRVEAARV
jgi:hypothetical protein